MNENKKTMWQTLSGMALLLLAATAYPHLPLEWRRHKDIKLGNTIAANIEQFRQTHGRLPHNTEAELLPLGFKHNKQGWQPNYRPDGRGGYRLIYDDGYDPPYLLWDSQEQQWHLEQSSLKTTQEQQ